MNEMKPCPFCGSETEYWSGWANETLNNNQKRRLGVRKPKMTCRSCDIGVSFGHFAWGVSDEEAKRQVIEAWNRRAG
jgi:Lar family restriction alleviation protein